MLKKKKEAYEQELREEQTLRMTFERMAMRLKEENKVLQSNNEALERETRYLREKLQAAEGEAQVRLEAFDELRGKLDTLLRSAYTAGEVWGTPKYIPAGAMPEAVRDRKLEAYLGRMEDQYVEDEAPAVNCIYYNRGRCKSVDSIYQECDGDCAYRRPK